MTRFAVLVLGLLASVQATSGYSVTSTGMTGGEADLSLKERLERGICRNPVTFYDSCDKDAKKVGEYRIEKGSVLAHVKGNPQAIRVPAGCRATVFTEVHHRYSAKHSSQAIILKGPKKKCLANHDFAPKALEIVHDADPSVVVSMIDDLEEKSEKIQTLEHDLKHLTKMIEQKSFRGPTGAQGAQGEKGDTGAPGRPGRDGRDGQEGKRGPKGTDGIGLHLKRFALGARYQKGDYVFAMSTKKMSNSMFIAERNFVARKQPSDDIGNWEEFEAPQGPPGRDGLQGATGIDGVPGKDGARGATGSKGMPGEAGKDGKDGERGAPGQRGEKGKDGINGRDGIGITGARGPQGERGSTGKPGLRGPTGLQGAKGEQGAAGVGLHLKVFKIGNSYKKGDYVFVKGASHDIMYVAEQAFVAKKMPEDEPKNWIPFQAPAGPKGDRGEQGVAGRDGDPGKDGERGQPGPKGDVGERGVAGEKGDEGERGVTGPKGEVGEPGKKGDRGDDGATGAKGSPGKAGEDLEKTNELLRADVDILKAQVARLIAGQGEHPAPGPGPDDEPVVLYRNGTGKDPLPYRINTSPQEFSPKRFVKCTDFVHARHIGSPGGIECTRNDGSYSPGCHSTQIIEEHSIVRGVSFVPLKFMNARIGLTYADGKSNNHKHIDFAIRLDTNRYVYVDEVGVGRTVQLGQYLPGDDMSVIVAKDFFPTVKYKIEYRVNGLIRYVSKKRPAFPLMADFSLTRAGDAVANARLVGEAPTYQQRRGQFIQFTNYDASSVEVGPGRIKKTKSASTGWNSGAHSVNAILYNSKITGVSFVTDQRRYSAIGLARHDNNRHLKDIDFALYFGRGSNEFYVYEHGVNVKHMGQYKINDIFQIRINQANEVEYVKNGEVMHTSLQNVILPLYVDAEMYDSESSLSDIRWLGEQTQLVEKTVGSPIQFTKFDGLFSKAAGFVGKAEHTSNSWNGGATSLQAIHDNDDVTGISFVPDTQNVQYVVGFQRKDKTKKSPSYGDIDYGMFLNSNGYVYIYEKGRQSGSHYSKWSKGDMCQVRIDSQDFIEYLVNGKVIFTTRNKVVLPIFAAAAIHNQNTALTHFTWTSRAMEKVPVAVDNKVVFTQFRYTSSKGPGFVSNNNGNSRTSWHNTARSVDAITEELAKENVRGVSFRPMRNDQHQGAGLTNKEQLTHYNDITYCMTTDSSHNVYIYEQGRSRGHFGRYQPGDKFEVILNRENKIQYWVNDEIRYTSSLSPSFPLYVGASMYNIGSQLHSVQWETYKTDAIKPKQAGKPIQFTNYQHTTSDKTGDLRVSTTRTSYNNGAFSYYGIEKSDNIKGIEFVIGRQSLLTMVGLSESQYNRVRNGYSDMMYTMMFHSNNHVYIYEKGTHRSTPTTYGAGDKFGISISSDGRIQYLKNGGVIYTSSKYAQYPLFMDVELYNTQSSIKNARWLKK